MSKVFDRPTVTLHQSHAGQGKCPACGKDFAKMGQETGKLPLAAKAISMRHAIDQIEGALMRCPQIIDLPEKWKEPKFRRNVGILIPKVNAGQVYDICNSLEKCTEIINSEEYEPKQLIGTDDLATLLKDVEKIVDMVAVTDDDPHYKDVLQRVKNMRAVIG